MPSTRVLVIDNYDSFTYNLVQALATLGARCDVVLNDAIDVAEVRRRDPDAVLISPGPCSPDEAGVSLSVIREMAGELPVFGVCLGHQAIAQALGGRVIRAPRVMHGKTSPIRHDGRSIHRGLPDPFHATRYHSLLVDRGSLPPILEISAWTDEGEIMGLRHTELPLEGVQYHPESILTEVGATLLGNWLASIPIV
ncbi:MAG TPA: aminodeoxychorismate/anthranilate synthase component II [Polyangiaceae bacterium]|nr:aminodeoxychorismate/anthranilate synthase component II [Polyangiaceae bacterium]